MGATWFRHTGRESLSCPRDWFVLLFALVSSLSLLWWQREAIDDATLAALNPEFDVKEVKAEAKLPTRWETLMEAAAVSFGHTLHVVGRG